MKTINFLALDEIRQFAQFSYSSDWANLDQQTDGTLGIKSDATLEVCGAYHVLDVFTPSGIYDVIVGAGWDFEDDTTVEYGIGLVFPTNPPTLLSCDMAYDTDHIEFSLKKFNMRTGVPSQMSENPDFTVTTVGYPLRIRYMFTKRDYDSTTGIQPYDVGVEVYYNSALKVYGSWAFDDGLPMNATLVLYQWDAGDPDNVWYIRSLTFGSTMAAYDPLLS